MKDVHPGPRATLTVLLVLVLLSLGFTAPQEQEEISYERVRANPILREALSLNAPYEATSDPMSAEFKFRESWVDSQIDHFVKQTYVKLGELKTSVRRASSLSADLTTGDSEKRAQALSLLRQALMSAEDQSKGLRNSLSMVLVELTTKDKLDFKVGPAAEANGFREELEALSQQTANAERFIRDYFFQPTHVTSVTELKEANMLDYLKRVERIARSIRQKL